MNRLVLVLSLLVVLVAVVLKSGKYDEDALLVDFSDPPPLFIFIAVNTLAKALRSMADALIPPPIRMMDISFYYHTTMLAYLCSKFGIPDFLATGPKSVEEIAAHMQTENVLRVERLMYALASEGMTRLDKDLKFVNTPLSATLRSDHPTSIQGMLHHNVEDVWESWRNLEMSFGPNALKDSDSPWYVTHPDYSKDKGGVWKYFEENPAQEEQFGRAMMSIDTLGAKAMALDGPFQNFDRIIDIGGSHGHFLYTLLKTYPEAKGVVFDRPDVIVNFEHVHEKSYQDVGDRMKSKAGNFFEASTIPEAQDGDVYFMRYILHDWCDDDALKILGNIRKQMGDKQSMLLIGESAIPNRDKVGYPPTVYHIDIQMMAVFDALDRTHDQWKVLLEKAGFEVVAFHATRSLLQWVEAKPV